ncbi:MAG: DNA translocase FtsK 4TM domain-containing protein, partial [Defluviitaleaceae bacterium]|nr:DNA translocase FtsK 4TM domain-containing protein [Defluviitaleaceae bacterium]
MASKSGKKKKRPTAGKTSRASSSGAKRKPAVSGKPARKREAASSRGTGRTGRPVKQTSPLTREIVSILFIGLAILLFLSVYINGAGAAEAFLKRFIVGLFGVGGYLLPFALAGFSVYGLISKPKRPGGMRRSAVSFAFLFLFVISAAHVINWQASASSLSFTQYIQALYVDGRVSNGGLIGGVFGNFLTAVFQKAGSVVILAVGILAMAVIFTGQSIVGAFRAIASSIRSVSRNSGDEGDEEDFEGEETDMRDERERGAQGLDIAAPGKKPRAGALEVGGARQAASGGRDEKKLMLFQEEVVKRKSENPLFGSRRIERDENWQGNVKKGGKKPYIDINKRERAVPEPDDETAPDAGREIKLSGLVEADKAAAGRDLYEDEDEESAYTRDIDDFEPDGEADAADVAVKPESGRAVRRVELFPARETAHRANAEAKREPEPELRFQPPQPEYQPQPAKARRQAAEIPENISTCEDEKYADYKLPPLNLMKKSEATATLGSRAEILENSRKLE